MIEYSDKDRETDFDYFVNNYDGFFKKYGHKFIVIRKQEVLGCYDDTVKAIDATTKTYPLGTFIVQECNGDESGYTNYISSWQIFSI